MGGVPLGIDLTGEGGMLYTLYDEIGHFSVGWLGLGGGDFWGDEGAVLGHMEYKDRPEGEPACLVTPVGLICGCVCSSR